MQAGVEQETLAQPPAEEELLEHQERENESDEPGDESRRPHPGSEDGLERDRHEGQAAKIAQRHEATLEDPLRMMSAIVGVVLVLVEDPQVEEEEQDRQDAEQ